MADAVVMPGAPLLTVVAILAGLLFILGSIQAFSDLGVPRRRRRRRRRRRSPARPEPREVPRPSPEPAAGASAAPISDPVAKSVVPSVPQPVGSPRASVFDRPPTLAVPETGVTRESAGHPHAEQLPVDQTERGKMVVRYSDGRVVKGYSYDFSPHKPRFHLLPAGAGSSLTADVVEVRIRDLKAVLFVRDFGGDPSSSERKEFAEGERPPGRKVEVTFKDGEVLVGSTVGYDPRRRGFFFIPADPHSNTLKVFAVSGAVTKVRFL